MCVAGAQGLRLCPLGSYAATQSSCVICGAHHWKSSINNHTACLV